jgi:hypothetical protein
MQNAIAGSLKIRTVQYVNLSAIYEALDLSARRMVAIEKALSGDISWGDAPITLVRWQTFEAALLEAVRQDAERLGYTDEKLCAQRELASDYLKHILPSPDQSELYVNLER